MCTFPKTNRSIIKSTEDFGFIFPSKKQEIQQLHNNTGMDCSISKSNDKMAVGKGKKRQLSFSEVLLCSPGRPQTRDPPPLPSLVDKITSPHYDTCHLPFYQVETFYFGYI
jgi:hypothetical protein